MESSEELGSICSNIGSDAQRNSLIARVDDDSIVRAAQEKFTLERQKWEVTMCKILLIVAICCLPASAAYSAAKKGEECGGFGGIKCDTGLFCDHKPGKCDVDHPSGTCIVPPDPDPKNCPKSLLPVCGCDNVTYLGDCERILAGQQKKHDDRCRR